MEEPEDSQALARLLESRGYHTVIACTGRAAWVVADSCRPDVALVELELPDVDGQTLAERLAALQGPADRRPLIVGLTRLGRSGDCRRADHSAFDLHLTRPIDPGTLFPVLRRFSRILTPPDFDTPAAHQLAGRSEA